MSYFANDIKKLYTNRLVLLALSMLLVIAVIDPIFMRQNYEIAPNPFMWWLFMNRGIGSTIFNSLRWLFPALLTGLVFFDERRSSIHGILITKGSRTAYWFSKILSVFLVSFISLAIIFLLNLILVYMVCPATAPISDYLIPKAGSLAHFLYQKNPLIMAITYNILHAFAMAVLSVFYVCLQMVFKSKNRYIAILLPPLLMYAADFAVQLLLGVQYSLTVLLQPVAASALSVTLSSNYFILAFGSLIIVSTICFFVGCRTGRDVL